MSVLSDISLSVRVLCLIGWWWSRVGDEIQLKMAIKTLNDFEKKSIKLCGQKTIISSGFFWSVFVDFEIFEAKIHELAHKVLGFNRFATINCHFLLILAKIKESCCDFVEWISISISDMVIMSLKKCILSLCNNFMKWQQKTHLFLMTCEFAVDAILILLESMSGKPVIHTCRRTACAWRMKPKTNRANIQTQDQIDFWFLFLIFTSNRQQNRNHFNFISGKTNQRQQKYHHHRRRWHKNEKKKTQSKNRQEPPWSWSDTACLIQNRKKWKRTNNKRRW